MENLDYLIFFTIFSPPRMQKSKNPNFPGPSPPPLVRGSQTFKNKGKPNFRPPTLPKFSFPLFLKVLASADGWGGTRAWKIWIFGYLDPGLRKKHEKHKEIQIFHQKIKILARKTKVFCKKHWFS